MDALQWENHPLLDRPILLAGFAGWNDAGDAATSAIRHLATHWRARAFATIDCEEFFDFSENRPIACLEDGVTRRIEWPGNRFTSTNNAPIGRDIIFLHGQEPQLKWRTFCGEIVQCAQSLGVEMVITLGALLADIPHTRPAPVTATAAGPDLLDRFHLVPSRYEGPTGINGVLHDSCAKAKIPSISLWAAVPHYISQTSSPLAALALVQQVTELLDTSVSTVDLEIASMAYERQVSEIVAEDEDMVAYVTQLEDSEDHTWSLDGNVVDEAERFLREQGH